MAAQGAKPKVIAVVGPTASGKTSLGIHLAQKLMGEVVSADSRQVYRGLDIGTGKVTKKEAADVPHHLINVASPKRTYTAGSFVRDAHNAIEGILQRDHVPIVVGGTGFYVDTLLGRMSFPEVPPNPALRAGLDQKDVGELFALLQKKDPRRAATIEPEHKRRLIRALEIAEALGTNPPPAPEQRYEVLWLGLNPGEQKLRKNIRARLLERISDGMVDEAHALHARGLSYRRMEELGLEYRSLARLLQGEVPKEEFIEELERAINHYAKRQMRWFKRNKDIRWVANKSEALRLAKEFVRRG